MAETTASPVIAFGEILWDLLPDGRALGGAPANFAYRLHALGTPTALVSRVGRDPLGREILTQMRDKGVDTQYIQEDDKKPTGTVPIILNAKGDAEFTILPEVAYDYVEFTPALEALAKTCRAVCYGTLVQRSETTRKTLYKLLDATENSLHVLDINLRKDCYSPETVKESFNRANVLKLNRDETKVVAPMLGLNAENVAGFAESAFSAYELEVILVTAGSEGLYVFSRKGERVRIPGYQVKVADTVGSGDSFTAAFLHKFLQGTSLEESCKFANKVGALTASKKGGMPLIREEEIRAMTDVAAIPQ